MRYSVHAAGWRAAAAAATVLLAQLAGAMSADAADSAVISTLLGNWGGSGRVQYTDGSSESIRCTAYYTGGGSELNMAIQCQSQTQPIHVRSRLKVDGARATGDWEERTYNVNGSATGRTTGDSLSLELKGGGFSGNMAVSFSKSQHSVNITTQGIGMSRASISLNRR